MPKGKYFNIGYGILLAFLIIFLGTLIDFIFAPIVILVSTLFAPILIAGVLFYIFRPIVNLLSKKLPRGLSILILYLVFAGILTGLVYFVGPIIQNQVASLIEGIPTFVDEAQQLLNTVSQQPWFQSALDQAGYSSLDGLLSDLSTYLTDFISGIGGNIIGIITSIAGALVVAVVIPFVLYYMLKEGKGAPAMILKLLPKKQEEEGFRILRDMDRALGSYIVGQVLVSICVGILIYIGYIIIGLEYALILALIAMVTNVIPFVGPWIGTFPGFIVGLFQDPLMGLLVIVVAVAVQMVESNLISPQIMGKRLHIHPVTIILLLLVASEFAGLLGLILAVPAYAVGKVIVTHTFRLIKLRNRKASMEEYEAQQGIKN
ncbi:putative PurR-regulated permease PerM [Sinobaca qinghaiensis]|uniref:Putative PurR-regulated permease PerM n=1 Tax=Sinobaca qinghaiensis TaxID=342944 RepID=A0A419V6Z6_9BACL|nr:AI-2E family transporter [Sinobaca qinghaiensis]RKD75621.1 putative PurR-regulated permease PerM [Sinobaca qinghaiensis]